MAYDFTELKQKVADTQVWLKKEYLGVRTGRATPALLDSVRVESYGSHIPINQVGTVSVEDARTLRITVWDTGVLKEIEKAITYADLGVSVSLDEKGARVIFPELTSERREQLLKLVKDKLEHARVSLRSARDEAWADIQKREKDKEIGSDDKFRYKDDMQKMIDEGNKNLDLIAEGKEKEIMN